MTNAQRGGMQATMKLNANAILDRLGMVANCEDDVELAEVLDVRHEVLSLWRTRMVIPWERLWRVSYKLGVDFDTLIAGDAMPVAINNDTPFARRLRGDL